MKKAVNPPSDLKQSTSSLTWSEEVQVPPLSAPQTYTTPPTIPTTKTISISYHCTSFGNSKTHAIDHEAIARKRIASNVTTSGGPMTITVGSEGSKTHIGSLNSRIPNFSFMKKDSPASKFIAELTSNNTSSRPDHIPSIDPPDIINTRIIIKNSINKQKTNKMHIQKTKTKLTDARYVKKNTNPQSFGTLSQSINKWSTTQGRKPMARATKPLPQTKNEPREKTRGVATSTNTQKETKKIKKSAPPDARAHANNKKTHIANRNNCNQIKITDTKYNNPERTNILAHNPPKTSKPNYIKTNKKSTNNHKRGEQITKKHPVNNSPTPATEPDCSQSTKATDTCGTRTNQIETTAPKTKRPSKEEKARKRKDEFEAEKPDRERQKLITDYNKPSSSTSSTSTTNPHHNPNHNHSTNINTQLDPEDTNRTITLPAPETTHPLSTSNNSTAETNLRMGQHQTRYERRRKYHINTEITFLQLNTQKSDLPTATLLERAKLIKGPTIILVTEPHCNKAHIPSGDTQDFTKFHHYDQSNNPRAAIYITKDIAPNARLHNELSDGDTCTISIESSTKSKKSNKANKRNKLKQREDQIYIISSYLANDKGIIGERLDKTLKILEKRKAEIIIGTDANAHHTHWGNTDYNARGHEFYDLTLDNNLNIENQGNTPTWHRTGCSPSIIDLTLKTIGAPNITNWKVIPGVSKSDHELIQFTITSSTKTEGTAKRMITNWKRYNKETEKLTGADNPSSDPNKDINIQMDTLNEMMIKAKSNTSKLVPKKRNQTPEIKPSAIERLILKKQNIKSIKHMNKKTKINNRRKLAYYLSKARKDKFKDFCNNIEKIPEAARANKILTKEHTPDLGTLKNKDGTSTKTTKETLTRLAEGLLGPYRNDSKETMTKDDKIEINQDTLDKITSKNRINKAINQLKLKKAPGPDNISNEMIQNAHDNVKNTLQEIIKQSFTTGIIPKSWKTANSAIIAKPNKSSYEEVKSRRIISLTSNILKLAETLMMWYLTEDCELGKKLHKNQMGFRAGYSTDAAIAKLVNKIKKCLSRGGHIFGVFLDIQGAFDNLPHDKIEASLRKTQAEPFAIRWITNMIKSRTIFLKSGFTTIAWRVSKGCPQGGVLSPFLWNLVLDDLLTSLNIHKNIFAYADDLVLIQEGSTKGREIAKQTATEHVRKIIEWCSSKGLEISTLKTQVVLWSNSKNPPRSIIIDNKQIAIQESAIYLGVHIDENLNWNTHIEQKIIKCNNLFNKLKKAIGKKWGLKPKVIKWIYQAIVLPKLSYGSVAWAYNLNKTQVKKLEKFQAQYARAITGANKSTPLLALNTITGLKDIQLHLKQTCLTRALALIAEGHWDEESHMEPIHHDTPMNSITRSLHQATNNSGSIAKLKTDKIKPILNLDQKFSCTVGKKKGYKLHHGADNIEIYTDGSKNEEEQTGYGAYKIDYRCPETGKSTLGRMESYNSVAQAELQAIESAAIALTDNNTTNRQITFLSDSASSIKALDKIKIKSNSVLKCKEALNKLSTKNNTVSLIWIPSHSNYDGNEIADLLAKAGAHSDLPIAQEAIKLIPHTTQRHKITKYMKKADKDKKANWQNNNLSEDCSPIFNLTADNDLAQEILINLPKNSLRTITKALTGHNELNKHSGKLKTASSNYCRDCSNLQKIEETALHLINNCPAHSESRQRIFGAPTIDFNALTTTMHPKSLINDTLTLLKKAKFMNKKPPFNKPQSPNRR